MKDAVVYKDILEKINQAPEKSGVYLFKSDSGKYIYIGKAKNLKNRLKGHLQALKLDPKEKKIFKESKILDWIITSSDYEAFVLENELIKQYKPKYNVRLKSGSSYPMLVITDEEYPTIKISRKYGEIKGTYFGPFIPAKTARAMKELIHKVFLLRTCDPMPKMNMACFDYHLGLCSAPCINKISKNDYKLNAKSAKAFLSGQAQKIIYKLYDKIEEYSQKLMFEKASLIRDQIIAIENLIKKQQIIGLPIDEADIFYITPNNVYIFIIRGKRFLGKDVLNKNELITEEEISLLIMNYYQKGNLIPSKIILSKHINDISNLEKWLNQRNPTKISTIIPKELENFIKRNIDDTDLRQLKELFEKVFEFPFPKRIEGFDISTLQGQFNVGSCVVWENGKMNKKEYRRYKIKSVKGIDDYASLREVLYRRFRKYNESDTPPELILIDGGKGQLKQGLIVKDALRLKDLRIFSIAKKEEIIYTDDGKEVHLYNYQPLLKMFTTIRDEAHRFAITYNRKLREKETLKSLLDNIEGIGKKRKEILYRTYKTIDNIISAPEEELIKLGIPKKVAQNIKKYFEN